jgi:hypothetical protein
MTLKVSQNTRNITAQKPGMAVYFPVSTRSMAMERRCSRLSWHFTTEAATTLSMKA